MRILKDKHSFEKSCRLPVHSLQHTGKKINCLTFSLSASRGQGLSAALHHRQLMTAARGSGGGDPRPTHPPARRHRRTPSPSLPRIICLCIHQITPSPHPRGQPGPLHPSQYDMQALGSATRRQSKGREGRAGEEEGREKHAALNYLLTPGQRLPFTH